MVIYDKRTLCLTMSLPRHIGQMRSKSIKIALDSFVLGAASFGRYRGLDLYFITDIVSGFGVSVVFWVMSLVLMRCALLRNFSRVQLRFFEFLQLLKRFSQRKSVLF